MTILELFTNYLSFLGTVVTLSGWVKHRRGQRKRLFVELTDGSCLEHVQVLFERSDFETHSEIFDSVKERMSLRITGELVKSPAEGQLFELKAKSYEILGDVHEDYPIEAKTELTMDYLRGYPSLRGHTETMKAIRRIKSRAFHAISSYYDHQGFYCVDEPFLTESACEGGCAPLQVTSLLEGKSGNIKVDYTEDFFRKPVYLTVSAQLHLECDALALGRVYDWTRAFRGEQSQTSKHVSEFTMLEHEFCFNTLEENIAMVTGAIKAATVEVLRSCTSDIRHLEEKQRPGLYQSLVAIARDPFIITSHEECVRAMLADVESGKACFTKLPGYEDDLASEHEKYIVDILYSGRPVAVRYFPSTVKSFYMPLMPDGKHVDCFDILFPRVGEIVGGSQRESDYERLMGRVHTLGLDPKPLQFYTDQRKYGTVPHGGMGLGFDRLVMYLSGTDNIRDVISFPRAFRLCEH